MGLHIFIRGNIEDYLDVIYKYDTCLVVDNNCSPQTQVNIAREYWTLYRNKEESIAVIIYSDFFIKEINTLIMLNYLSVDRRRYILNDNDFIDKGYNLNEIYNESMFDSVEGNLSLSIRFFDMSTNKECDLDLELGFDCDLFDNVIEFQNSLQDLIYSSD